MTLFLIAATLMLAAALFFILPTLLRGERGGVTHAQRDALNLDVLRDQLRELDADRASGAIDEIGYGSSRTELEHRVAEEVLPSQSPATSGGSRWPAIVVGILFPVMAIGLYWGKGNPDGLNPQQVAAVAPGQTVTAEQITVMVNKLAQHLKEKPDDIEGWTMLARSYNAMGRFPEAADAYAHLVKLVPSDADVMGDYAYALAMASNRSMQGEPEKLLNRALEINPKNIKALALSGSAHFERNDYQGAVTQWRKIMSMVPPNSDLARSVASSINQALSMADGVKSAASVAAQAPSDSSAVAPAIPATAQVSGTVELDPALRAQVADGDTVFIYARAVDGPRFPLAVLRKQVRDLPATFTLDDSMSMMPNAKLSGFSAVIVGARISKTGNATASPGDLEGMADAVHPGARGIKININTQRK